MFLEFLVFKKIYRGCCTKMINSHNKFRVPVLMLKTVTFEWRPFAHVAINHQPLTRLEEWKASKADSTRVVSRKPQEINQS